jgi:hypothetical protein
MPHAVLSFSKKNGRQGSEYMNSRAMLLKNQRSHFTPLNHSSQKIKELAYRTYPELGSSVKPVRSSRETSKTWKLKLFIF